MVQLPYFNPRSPCGERRGKRYLSRDCGFISIHAPRVGSDDCRATVGKKGLGFQSTLPVWGATDGAGAEIGRMDLFQSTLPVWGATTPVHPLSLLFLFQSTLPVWGATILFCR